MSGLRFTIFAMFSLCHVASAATDRAQVAWHAQSSGYEPGQPVITALRMTLSPGWHTYWINPGEAGMPLSANFELPDGWSAEPPQFPLPMRFNTGEMHDFGYEGTVWFPIILHPPVDADGDVKITGAFSWLVCDDSACIPGNATLQLSLTSSANAPTPFAEDITRAMHRIPIEAPEGWKLDVSESKDSLKLRLKLPSAISMDNLDVFPHTPNLAHPAATYDWQPMEGGGKVEVAKSPFAPEAIESFDLVIAHPALERPIWVEWSSK